jgi:hypothetical protein
MSEIYSPGSIAGPPAVFMGPHNLGTSYAVGQAVSCGGSSYVSLVDSNAGNPPASSPAQWGLLAAGGANGANGATGAAGSQGSVTALASATLPSFVGRNLFDASQAVIGLVQADGTINPAGGWGSSGLIYCPGATSMISNLAIFVAGGGGCCFALYDANGAFIGTVPETNFSTTRDAAAYVAWPLPGTQVYVRFGWVGADLGGNGSASSPATAMFCVSVGGTAVLPGTYQTGGLATASAMVAGDDAVATVVANSVSSSVKGLSNILIPINANRFDLSTAQVGYQTNADGTVSVSSMSNSPVASGMIYCPGATTLKTNVPIYSDNFSSHGNALQLFDAEMNFLGTAPLAAFIPAGYGGAFTALTVLPGTQTYIRFTMLSSVGTYQGPVPACVMVFTGTATNIAAMTQGTRFYPFIGPLPINQFARGNIKKASELGCALNCDFDNPGWTDGVSINDTALLNAFLATASETNPIKLIIDGCAYVTGLVISPAGYTTIEGIGWGSGLYVMSGSNQNAISVGCGSGPYDFTLAGNYNITPPARTVTNVMLQNFTINPNSGNNTNCHGVLFANCTNILLESMNIMQASWFASTYSNCQFIKVRGCQFISAGTLHDGVHIDGKCEDINISDCYFSTGDDAIALNAPEGYGGDISRVTVTNCIFDGSLSVMRIYTSLDVAAMPTNNVHKVRNVAVSNCTGRVSNLCISLGITNGGLSSTLDGDQIQDLSISNCTFSGPLGLAILLAPIGSIAFANVKFIPTTAAPVISVMYPSVGELELNGLRVVRNPDGNVAPASIVWVYSGASLDRVSIQDFAVIDEEGSSYASIPCIVDATGPIAALRLEGVDMTHVTALASSAGWASVTALRGGGVVGTGVAVPDSVMDNDALYLSSTASGAPSIKLGGVAKRFTLA